MAGFDHQHAATEEAHDDVAAARRSQYGLILFAIYSLLYGGFMVLNAFAPDLMEITPLWGINLAILYGFSLIAAALVLALVYAWLCRGGKDE
jgi:uncharacterized membrane protein (DUF485 family)